MTDRSPVPSGWRQWTTAVLDLLLPPLCALCERRLGEGRRDPLCGSCWERLPRVTPPFCVRCGRPFWIFGDHGLGDGAPSHSTDASLTSEPHAEVHRGLCEPCRRRPPPFAYARAATLYRDAAREALHIFKFRGKTSLARPLGDLLAEADEAIPSRRAVDCLVPVPLHPAREAERGFNQSLLLAERLSRRWAIPVAEGVLRRLRATRAQVELSAAERSMNVQGAFGASRPAVLAGAHALVIDDVFTTGATVSECSRVLTKDGGASVVGVLTVARVV